MNRTVATAVVAGHVALTLTHGLAHAAIPVPVAGWKLAAAGLVTGLPLAGLRWLRRGRIRAAAWLLLAVGLVGVGFEGPLHFLVANPDHVSRVTHGHVPFTLTAALTAGSDLLLVVVGGWLVVSARATSDPRENRSAVE